MNHFPNGLTLQAMPCNRKQRVLMRTGGMYEVLNYANFGIQEALLFRIAWINTHPGQNPGDIPQLAKIAELLLTSLLSAYRYAA